MQNAVASTTPIRAVMEVMDSTAVPIALVVDFNTDRLLGTITDGDIRRWILSGGGLDAEAQDVMNPKPIVHRAFGSGVSFPAWCTLIPVVAPSGRLVGLRDLRRQRQQTVVVIMAGGLGTRLRPLTDDTPKPMLEIGGKPMIQRLVEQFVAQGFTDVYISVGYKAEVIKDFFAKNPCGAQISFLDEDRARGTAGALALLPETDHPVIVVNGDVVTDVDFRKLLDFHGQSGAPATMGVTQVRIRVPYGVIQVQPGAHVLESIVEKPDVGIYVNAGVPCRPAWPSRAGNRCALPRRQMSTTRVRNRPVRSPSAPYPTQATARRRERNLRSIAPPQIIAWRPAPTAMGVVSAVGRALSHPADG